MKSYTTAAAIALSAVAFVATSAYAQGTLDPHDHAAYGAMSSTPVATTASSAAANRPATVQAEGKTGLKALVKSSLNRVRTGNSPAVDAVDQAAYGPTLKQPGTEVRAVAGSGKAPAAE